MPWSGPDVLKPTASGHLAIGEQLRLMPLYRRPAARAIVRELPGTPGDVAAWIGVEQARAPDRVG